MRKLLLADDSVTIQKVVKLSFADEDVEVFAVGDGDQAVTQLEQIHPDIVLADIYMPGRNGIAVCEYVKSHPTLSLTPVVLLVGTFEPFDKMEASRVRYDGVLTKPFETAQLIQLVHDLIAAADAKRAAEAAPPAQASALTAVSTSSFSPLEIDLSEGEPAAVAAPATVSATATAVATEADDVLELDWDRPTELPAGDGDSILELFDEDFPVLVAAGPAPSPEAPLDESVSEPPIPEVVSAVASPPEQVAAETIPTEPAATAAVPAAVTGSADLSEAQIDAIVQRVLQRLSDRVVREVAWEVVPDMAELLIKEQLKARQQPQ